MSRTLPKGIFKRGNNYALRYSVPTEIQPIIGKKEIVKSLATSDLGEALSNRASVLNEIVRSLFGETVNSLSTVKEKTKFLLLRIQLTDGCLRVMA